MTEDRRRRHAANAAAGIALTGGGEALGHAVRRQGGRTGKAGSMLLPRGMKALGIPLAATGAVGAARGRGRVDDLDVKDLPKDVAHGTVRIPGKPTSQRAADAGAATLAGGATGLILRQAGRSGKGRIALGTAGAAAGGSGALYGSQKGREAKRRSERWDKVANRSVSKAEKTIKIPAPTVNDTVEDWKVHRDRRRAANINAAATAVGAGALATRAPHHYKPKGEPSKRLVKLRRIGNASSTKLAGAAAGAYVVGGAINYKTQRHDLAVQRRRLVERDKALQGVRKDRFTRKYAQHISPEAEAGYDYLRRGRNQKRRSAAVSTGMTAINATAAVHGGKIMRPVGIVAGAVTGTNAVRQARGARRWNGHMKKIKAKAYERARAGEYGRGRTVPQAEVAKALIRRPSGLPFPKGLRRAPAMRAGSVRRTASGKLVAFRGAYG